jgi:hypothetical protein
MDFRDLGSALVGEDLPQTRFALVDHCICERSLKSQA